MYVLSDNQVYWVCCCKQLIYAVSEDAQCIYCTVMSYSDRCKCSLITIDWLIRYSDLLLMLWVLFFSVVFHSIFVSAAY